MVERIREYVTIKLFNINYYDNFSFLELTLPVTLCTFNIAVAGSSNDVPGRFILVLILIVNEKQPV